MIPLFVHRKGKTEVNFSGRYQEIVLRPLKCSKRVGTGTDVYVVFPLPRVSAPWLTHPMTEAASPAWGKNVPKEVP